MMLYGTEFPAFLERFQPLQHVEYLADVARLELAQRYAYHAADAMPINPAIFGELPPEALAGSTVQFAPAMHIIRSSWPVLDIWHFNMTDGAPQPSASAQDVLIARAEFDPVMLSMPAGSAELIALLQNQTTLGDALETIEQSHPDFDFSALLGLLLQTGALVALTPSK